MNGWFSRGGRVFGFRLFGVVLSSSAAIFLVCLTIPAQAPLPDVRKDRTISNPELVRWTSRYMDDAVRFDHFSGVVLIASGGRVLSARAYGLADAVRRTPNTRETRFRIGSVSKQFTAAAILLLRDAGKISLDDSVCRFIDECPDAWRPVLVRHLLQHTSGLVNITALDEARGDFLKSPHTPLELIALIRGRPLAAVPGSEFAYNNSGYLLLGAIVEKVAGEKFETFVRRHIFAPLRMKNTGFEADEKRVAKLAVAEELGDDFVFRPAGTVAPENLFAIGGAYSTADDLLRWDEALTNGRFLSEQSRREMFDAGVGPYGFGWFVDSAGDCRRRYHDGGVTGFSTTLQHLENPRLTVIAISNRGDDGGIRAGYDIVGRICGAPATIRSLQPEISSQSAEKSFAMIEKARAGFARFDASERKIEEIGNYLMLTGKRPQSVEVFKLNTMLYPASARTHYKLGMAFKANGRIPEAKTSFKTCLELDPNFEEAKKERDSEQ